MEHIIVKSFGTFVILGIIVLIIATFIAIYRNIPFTIPIIPTITTIPTTSSFSFLSLSTGINVSKNIIYGIPIVLLLIGIFAILPKCSGSDRASAGPTYEPFDTGMVLEMEKRIKNIQNVKTQLERDLEDLTTSVDDACGVLKQVEDTYISNSAAPTNADEMNLPKDVQDRRIASRTQRAIVSFKERMKQYVGIDGKTPVYECFVNDSDNENKTTEMLQNLVAELSTIMNSAEIKAASYNEARIRTLVGFNSTFLKKTVDAVVGKESFTNEIDPQVPVPMPVPIPLTGIKLLQRADDLISEAEVLHNKIVALKQDVLIQRKTSAALDAKASNLANGKFNQSDVNAAISH